MSASRSVRVAMLIVVAIIANACNRRGTEDAARSLTSIAALGALTAPGLLEASGVVRSSTRANVFWSQNDSGNDAQLFAYDSTGASLGVTSVSGARNRDWEAIALGPCPDGSCIYIGDVGDNSGRREYVTIWRVREPTPGDSITTPAVPLRFHYSDGPRDVEALWVSPDTTVWLLSKRPMFRPDGTSRPTQLYRLPASAWRGEGEQVATLVDSLPIVPLASDDRSGITDASLSTPDSSGARHVAVRTYNEVYVFTADSVSGRPSALEHRCSLNALRQGGGEGVAWLADGRLLFNAEGRGSLLLTGRCR